MNFQNPNGTGRISIRLSEIGSYLHFDQPLTAVWYDCRGSVGKYLCQLPISKETREELRNKIDSSTDRDFKNKETELKSILDPLLTLLPKGEFTLKFHSAESKDFFWSRENNPPDWFPISAQVTDLQQADQKVREFKAWQKEDKRRRESFTPLEYSTGGFYDGSGTALIFTEPDANISQHRIKHYEEIIKNGGRPFVIIFNAKLYEYSNDQGTDNYSLESDHFVLDGHHKLQAYYNLKIVPAIAEITHLSNTRDDVEFDVEDLIEVMFPWQVEHILKNWYNKDKHIWKYLDDENSKIHLFIKNGRVKEYYDNGNIKHYAYYENDVIEGKGTWWHENGTLWKEEFWHNKVRKGTWNMWYDSGVLQFVQPFNDLGQQHGHMISYWEDGKKRWEQMLENGRNVDGDSYITYHRNGSKDVVLKYQGGNMIERNQYDVSGKLTKTEKYER